MRFARMLKLAGAALVMAVAGTGSDVRAQEERVIDDNGVAPACPYRTRWTDAFGKCPSCCDAVVYACPCTV